MGIFKKKEKEPMEPQWYMSATHIEALNYKVYYLNAKEKIGYFMLAFVVGALVGYLFYGGLAKDAYGNPTVMTYILNVVITGGVGLIAGKLFLPMRARQIRDKRIKQLKVQFRDMLDGITTSLGAGNNVINSFNAVYNDLKVQYSEDAFIIKEIEIILSGVNSNFDIEDMLEDFGRRSGVSDIDSFANVFKVCYRKGGNIQEVIHSTHSILSQKMTINEDIETTISGSKMDQNIMLIMPVLLIAMIKMMSPEFAENFTSMAGIISTTIAIGCFGIAYYVGKVFMDIKV